MIGIEKVEIRVDAESVYEFKQYAEKLFQSIFTWPFAIAYRRALREIGLWDDDERNE